MLYLFYSKYCIEKNLIYLEKKELCSLLLSSSLQYIVTMALIRETVYEKPFHCGGLEQLHSLASAVHI